MTHDPTKGCYTLDTLRALNPLYDHEHGLTQQDVEAVNAMKKYIESTRSADRPQCGDRVRYVSRHGDYAGSALIAYDRNDMLTVCICPYDPFASRPEFRQLKAELRLGIRQWIDDNGPPGYEAKLRHRVRTRKMRDGEPKKTNRNK